MIGNVLGGAGIVDEAVDVAPLRRCLDDLLAVVVAGDIALHHDDLGAGLAAKVGGLVGFLLAGRVVDDHAGAAAGELARSRGAEAARRARNKHNQTIQRHRVSLLIVVVPECRHQA